MMEGEKGLLRDTRSSFLLFSRPVKMQNLNPVNCKFFAFRDTQTLTLNPLEWLASNFSLPYHRCTIIDKE